LSNIDGSTLYKARIEREIPTTVSRENIEGVEFIRGGYIEELVKSINLVVPKEAEKSTNPKN